MPYRVPAWALAISRCYGFDGFALAFRDTGSAAGDHVAGFPVIELRHPLTRRRRWSSLPFTDTCPALVAPDDASAFARAVDAYRMAVGIGGLELSGPLHGVPGVTSGGPNVACWLRLYGRSYGARFSIPAWLCIVGS